MAGQHIFISHATGDDAFVRRLRLALEGQRISVCVDSRTLRGGDMLAPEISLAIDEARHVLVVLSPLTVNSPWVRREVKWALDVADRRRAEGFRVVPLLLPGITPAALGHWFDIEPVAVPISISPTGVGEAMPAILAALGERLPDDATRFEEVSVRPVDDLVLTLNDANIRFIRRKRHLTAHGTVIYEPADRA